MRPISRRPAPPRADCAASTTEAPPQPGAGLLPEDAPRAASAPRQLDRRRAEHAVRELLAALGVDPAAHGLADTPRRVVDAYRELLHSKPFQPTTFPAEARDQLVVVSGIAFGSLCEHHLLPFAGAVHVGYVPGESIIGLSKLARLVAFCAAGLTVQERVTSRIADRLEEILAPRGVGVVVEATHACMSVRGVHQPGATTRTSVLRGVVRDDPAVNREFLDQASRGAVRR